MTKRHSFLGLGTAALISFPSFAPVTLHAGQPASATEAARGAAAGAPALVEVLGGTVSFDVTTNLPVLSVHGKSTGLLGRARVRQGAGDVVLEQLEATVPVMSIGTGIGQRDEHMRKLVFTAPDGRLPDLRLVSERSTCGTAGAGRETRCQVSGQLSIRGAARPFTIELKVKDDNGRFRASGDTMVKLSSYGIERPSQLGVTTADEVTLHVEFTAGPCNGELASAREGGN
jgi:polyisoprenoid-binding protein YceI